MAWRIAPAFYSAQENPTMCLKALIIFCFICAQAAAANIGRGNLLPLHTLCCSAGLGVCFHTTRWRFVLYSGVLFFFISASNGTLYSIIAIIIYVIIVFIISIIICMIFIIIIIF